MAKAASARGIGASFEGVAPSLGAAVASPRGSRRPVAASDHHWRPIPIGSRQPSSSPRSASDCPAASSWRPRLARRSPLCSEMIPRWQARPWSSSSRVQIHRIRDYNHRVRDYNHRVRDYNHRVRVGHRWAPASGSAGARWAQVSGFVGLMLRRPMRNLQGSDAMDGRVRESHQSRRSLRNRGRVAWAGAERRSTDADARSTAADSRSTGALESGARRADAISFRADPPVPTVEALFGRSESLTRRGPE